LPGPDREGARRLARRRTVPGEARDRREKGRQPAVIFCPTGTSGNSEVLFVYVGNILPMKGDLSRRLREAVGFDWDAGNVEKNWVKHSVRYTECEEVFSREPVVVPVRD